ncbi:MAG: M23 family metallopeptidase, partial [Chloroflexi bacterium]|nr:M23 family metallopeptidase [Chloroflexota bacterium]
DGLRDVKPQIETDGEHPAGNHVVIEVAEDAYLYIAHLQRGSLLVAEGDRVAAGQEIGRVGNSGNTTEPHIHIHLQDMPDMFAYNSAGAITSFTDAIGLPLPFSDIEVNGKPFVETVPLGGQFAQQRGEPECCTGL